MLVRTDETEHRGPARVASSAGGGISGARLINHRDDRYSDWRGMCWVAASP